MVHAFVLVDAEPDRIDHLATAMADIEGVAEVYSVTGEIDLLVVVRVARHEDLADVVTRRISCLDGVRATETMVAFQAYGKRDLEAMWDLGTL
jgi:DNA-binding Lrp family transcriptional regulator